MPPEKTIAKSVKPDYEKRIVRALRQLMQKLDAHSRKLFNDYDVTIPQVMCVDELHEKGTMTVTTLANAIHLSPSTTVGIIDRLEKKNLVKRVRDKMDRRSVFVEITDKGREFVQTEPHLVHNKMHSNIKNIPDHEQVQIANSLDLLLVMMNKKN